ncbi:MAG: hypothetical protein ABIP93_13445 [Gemmatimonadaceae bacterium]
MMGMLKMIASMMGSSSPAIGFLGHMMISAAIGAGFGLVLGGRSTSGGKAVGAGLGYGLLWWVLGPLTIMPLMMGMAFGSQWNAPAMQAAMPSLLGHLVYGGVLGFTYYRLARGARSGGRAAQFA